MVEPTTAAAALLKILRIPEYAASVRVWYGEDGIRLIVRIDPEWRYRCRNIPSYYEGYPVQVEDRDTQLPA